jgi:hypothetical protein
MGKWQPEYQTQSHQINQLAMALKAGRVDSSSPGRLFVPLGKANKGGQ